MTNSWAAPGTLPTNVLWRKTPHTTLLIWRSNAGHAVTVIDLSSDAVERRCWYPLAHFCCGFAGDLIRSRGSTRVRSTSRAAVIVAGLEDNHMSIPIQKRSVCNDLSHIINRDRLDECEA